MDAYIIVWIILFAVFSLIEAATISMVTIWFAIGTLFAIAANLLGASPLTQVIVFVIVSIIMLISIFPFVRKKMKAKSYDTNVDALIGKTAVVKEIISLNKIGQVSVNGVIWSATGEGTFDKEEVVTIINVEGNKLIVERKG